MTHLAIAGGTPHRPDERAWPSRPIRGEEAVTLVAEVVRQGPWSYNGPKEAEFAARFAAYQGVRHGFCVANGTVSLELCLRALGIKVGDEVIVPALTWIATASAAMYAGATVVFADIDPHTYQLDAQAVEAAITARTRAIIPVHLYARLADMDALNEVARRHNLAVVEDCAHGHGGIWSGRRTGSMGQLGSFSFQESKVLPSGEGGFITTNDAELAELIYGLKNCGRSLHGDRRQFVLGSSYRITEMQAALLLAQLPHLDGQVDLRDRNALRLDADLAGVEGIRPLRRDPRIDRQSYYGYIFRYDPAAFGGAPVHAFREALAAEGVPCGPTYGPVYATDLWGPGPHQPWRIASSAAADRVDDEAVVLFHSLLMAGDDDMNDIVAAVRKVQAHHTELRGLQVQKPLPASVSGPRRA